MLIIWDLISGFVLSSSFPQYKWHVGSSRNVSRNLRDIFLSNLVCSCQSNYNAHSLHSCIWSDTRHGLLFQWTFHRPMKTWQTVMLEVRPILGQWAWNYIPLTSLVLIIIFINCNWVVTRWQCLLYMSANMKMVRTNMKMVNTKFKTGVYIRSM